jgi:Tannase and feruloyl esterase
MKPIAENEDSALQVEHQKPLRPSSKLRCFSIGAFGALCALYWGGVGGVEAANLPVVTPVTTCADLLQLDFTGLEDAPTKLDSAVVVEASASNPTEQCVVTGYVAPKVKFTVRMLTQNWTQRLVMVGCGGYCGDLITPTPASYGVGGNFGAAVGCPFLNSGELAIAAHNGGHTGNTDTARFLAAIADGMWAIQDTTALIDFFYASNHKATVAAKAIMKAFYGQSPTYSYFDGCSSGGRAALHEAQRFPDDCNGILAGSPTIDNTSENTFLHSWNVRVNSNADSTSILTADKIPALAQAVLAVCADNSGMIQDPRTCHFDARKLLCPSGTNSPNCLTAQQAKVANLVWQGPVDQTGILMSPGDQPYGSELAWAGSIALAPGVAFNQDTSSEFAFSYDFPNYMSNWFVTGITNQNIQFTRAEFQRLDFVSGLNDPTNPDLRAFSRQGGKLLMWEGYTDQGTSFRGTLNYYAAVRGLLGSSAAARFMSLYLLPGVYHCAGGPIAATFDFLTPLISWVEDGVPPGKVTVAYRTTGDATSPVTRTRPVFPYPATSVYTGQGNVNDAANYVQGPPTPAVADVLPWLGLKHYVASHQVSCEVINGKVQCEPEISNE